jgi:phage FluMu gp28-like protein
MKTPLDILLPYQRDWTGDTARFKIGLWGRQTGKSFSTAAEAVADAYQRKTTWVTLSAGERQALEWMRKAQEWCEAFGLAISDYAEDRAHAEALMNKAEITLPNGSRIIGIPANPDTARGYSANLTLDEFAFHEDPDAIWRAVYPSISNPLKGIFKIRVVSTPNGQGNKFHDLWIKEGVWSKHKVDIHTAIARGLPLNADELRAGLDDAEGWAQEYECQFLDSAAVLLPYELIALCESPEATMKASPEFWQQPGLRVMGLDFGRKKDLTVAATADLVADLRIAREVLELSRMSTPDQFTTLAPRIEKVSRVCVDYTGPGIGLGDLLVQRFGEWNPKAHQFGKIELCTFTNALKLELFPTLRVQFEKRNWRIPMDRVLREDLHSMHRVTTPQGGVSYKAPHTADGHADRCTAIALCERAAATAGVSVGRPVAFARKGIKARRNREVTV